VALLFLLQNLWELIFFVLNKKIEVYNGGEVSSYVLTDSFY
jgi:hypothetical protein